MAEIGSIHARIRGSRDWIAFSGTSTQVEAALHTSVHRNIVGGETHFAVATEPTIPSEVKALVATMFGLTNFGRNADGNHMKSLRSLAFLSLIANAAAGLPDWLAPYDHANHPTRNPSSYVVKASAASVLDFYKEQMRKAGIEFQVNEAGDLGVSIRAKGNDFSCLVRMGPESGVPAYWNPRPRELHPR